MRQRLCPSSAVIDDVNTEDDLGLVGELQAAIATELHTAIAIK